jgi:hypothetical protein
MKIPTIHETDGTIIIQKTSISAAGKSLLQELTDMNRCAITEETSVPPRCQFCRVRGVMPTISHARVCRAPARTAVSIASMTVSLLP